MNPTSQFIALPYLRKCSGTNPHMFLHEGRSLRSRATAILAADRIEQLRRVAAARGLPEPENAWGSVLEILPVFDYTGQKIEAVPSYMAHRMGIRHQTANLIVVLPNGLVILQQRAMHQLFFPGGWGLSAGGHMKIEKKNDLAPTPLQVIREELAEELGLNNVNTERFIDLGVAPNFLRVWEYEKNNVQATILQFDAQAEDIFIDVKNGALSAAEKSTIKELVKTGKNSLELQTKRRNEELCSYFILVITAGEYLTIQKHSPAVEQRTDGTFVAEVAGLRAVPLEEVIKAGRNLATATDNLYSLFYNRVDIADRLRQIVSQVLTTPSL